MRVVMEILGHTQMATTADIYSHVLPSLMEEAAGKMDAMLNYTFRGHEATSNNR